MTKHIARPVRSVSVDFVTRTIFLMTLLTGFIGLLSVLFLSGCQSAPETTKPNPIGFPASFTSAQADLIAELDALMKQWYGAATAGLTAEQEKIAGELKTKVNQNFDFVVRLIRLNDRELKLIAGAVLGFSGQESAVPFLLSALSDESDLVRANALFSIGLIGDKDTPVTNLVKGLEDKSPRVRSASAFALSRVTEKGKRGIICPALVKMLDDPEPTVRNEAIRALALCGDATAVEPLIKKGLNDKYDLLVLNTVLALGALKDRKAIEPLIDLASRKEDPNIKEAILTTLNYITDTKFETIAQWQKWWDDNKARD